MFGIFAGRLTGIVVNGQDDELESTSFEKLCLVSDIGIPVGTF